MIDLTINLFILFFFLGLFAGFFDSISGGGGLLTIPVMLIAGVPPLVALGTNKLQGLFGTASATITFAAKLAKLPLRSQPGERYHYSVAVDVTGLIVERISGQRLDKYIQEHILAPLEMNDTFFEVPESERDRFAQNHFINPKTGALVNSDYAPAPYGYRKGVALSDYFDVTLFAGGAGLVSTAMDYARFAEMLRRGGELDGVRILGPKTVKFMTRNHLSEASMHAAWGQTPTADIGRPGFGFGLGLGVVTDSAAIGVLGSDGEYNWGGAAGTIFWVDPVEELVVVSMIQLMQSPWPFRADVKIAIYQDQNLMF